MNKKAVAVLPTMTHFSSMIQPYHQSHSQSILERLRISKFSPRMILLHTLINKGEFNLRESS